MLPSIIAFKDRREAEHFIEKQGGELISFSQALLTISPAAMTMPVRIKTAAVPSKGSSGIGIGYMSMKMDTVKIGSDSADPEDFVQRPGQMMGPKEMKAQSKTRMISSRRRIRNPVTWLPFHDDTMPCGNSVLMPLLGMRKT